MAAACGARARNKVLGLTAGPAMDLLFARSMRHLSRIRNSVDALENDGVISAAESREVRRIADEIEQHLLCASAANRGGHIEPERR